MRIQKKEKLSTDFYTLISRVCSELVSAVTLKSYFGALAGRLSDNNRSWKYFKQSGDVGKTVENTVNLF